MLFQSKSTINHSNYISRDLSWLKFNLRVLDQVRKPERNVFEKLKFLAITSSNLDEFFEIRVGSLYNYLDYGKERTDYSGLREEPFRKKLLSEVQNFYKNQLEIYTNELKPVFEDNGFIISDIQSLSSKEIEKVSSYFKNIIFPMLTPMVYDSYHSFPILMNKLLIFGVVTINPNAAKDNKRLSFIQIPQNLPRFYELERDDKIVFISIEEIIRWRIDNLYKNVQIVSVDLFRLTRNGDFSLDESDDMEARFIDEIKRKLKSRRTGRVVRIEIQSEYSNWMMKTLMERWDIDEFNIFKNDQILDYNGVMQIVGHKEFRGRTPANPTPVPPISFSNYQSGNIFEHLKHQDILLHHPYNTMQPVIDLLEKSAEDPNVLAIKITIYRLAKESRISNALLKAAENGKHVSVLFEVKARFDEENNIKEAQRLQKAGCFVIYGIGSYKTHTKLMLIVRKEGEKVRRYVHMSSGNYNEDTAKFYTDLSLLSTNEVYAHDINDFFNVITGHSLPSVYQNLITAPGDMRSQLIELIDKEAQNASKGLPSGIVIKLNSFQDKETIDAFYKASQAGVPIKLVVRGMCCLRPGRAGLSENITVKSIVGDFLEHTRLFYFHNNGDPKVYGGSADMMVRSFERRIESLFLIVDPLLKKQAINILAYNLKDNVNSYILQEDGNYVIKELNGEEPFNIHHEFYKVTEETINKARLFE
ncbi:MAG: polyphosphate kinase 1 [Cytophagaceae bacterium]